MIRLSFMSVLLSLLIQWSFSPAYASQIQHCAIPKELPRTVSVVANEWRGIQVIQRAKLTISDIMTSTDESQNTVNVTLSLKDDVGNWKQVYDGKGLLTGFVGKFSKFPDSAKFFVIFGKGEFSYVSKQAATGIVDVVSNLAWEQNHFDDYSDEWSPVQEIERVHWMGCIESESYCKTWAKNFKYCGFTAESGFPDCPADPTMKHPKTTGCWGHYLTFP